MRIKAAVLAAISIAAAGALLDGCKTIDRARAAQAAQRDAALNVRTSVRERVNLTGMDLSGLVDFAVTNRPDVVQAALAVMDAKLALKQIAGERALDVGMSGGFGQSTSNTDSHFSWREHRGKFSGAVSAELLIYDFGRIDAKEAAARENLVAAQLEYANLGWTVFNEVSAAYFTLLEDDALLEVARTNLAACVNHLSQAEKLFEAQEANKLDVLKARLDVSDARLKEISASNTVVAAGAELLKVLGLDAEISSRDEIIPARPDALSYSEIVYMPSSYSSIDAIVKARETSPSLAVLRAKLRAASDDVDYAIADLMPSLSLSGTFTFTDPTWNFSWAANFVQSLFNGFRKTKAVDRAVIAMKTARSRLDAAEQALSLNLVLAITARDNARESLETAKAQVEQARENMDLVTQQFRLGEASRIDFTDAVNELASAHGARIKAFYTGQIAEAKLIALIGADDASHEDGASRMERTAGGETGGTAAEGEAQQVEEVQE